MESISKYGYLKQFALQLGPDRGGVFKAIIKENNATIEVKSATAESKLIL